MLRSCSSHSLASSSDCSPQPGPAFGLLLCELDFASVRAESVHGFLCWQARQCLCSPQHWKDQMSTQSRFARSKSISHETSFCFSFLAVESILVVCTKQRQSQEDRPPSACQLAAPTSEGIHHPGESLALPLPPGVSWLLGSSRGPPWSGFKAASCCGVI